jgi:hypothetical protein
MNAVNTDPSEAPRRVGDVVRDVIAQVAPEELPLVDRLRPLGDRAAVRMLSRRKHTRDLLAFGIDEIVVLASPVVWIVVSEAVAHFTDRAITGGGRAARSGLRRLFRRAPVDQEIPRWTASRSPESAPSSWIRRCAAVWTPTAPRSSPTPSRAASLSRHPSIRRDLRQSPAARPDLRYTVRKRAALRRADRLVREGVPWLPRPGPTRYWCRPARTRASP